MSLSYKKNPVVSERGRNYCKFMKNYANRTLRRIQDHTLFPRGNTNRVRNWNVDQWDICEYKWHKSFEQWMVDVEREYNKAFQIIAHGWNTYLYTIDGDRILSKGAVRCACKLLAQGKPNRRKEYVKWRRMYLAK